MAFPTLTTDLTTVAIGYAGDAGTWSGGKSSANWTEAQIEGSECIAYVCNSATGVYELTFSPTTAINIGTSSVLRMWNNTSDPYRCQPKASKGIAGFITDNGTTYYWYLEGNDSGYYGGYFQAVIDTGIAADEGGTPAWTSVSSMGITNYKNLLGKNTETSFMDAIRYGNNLYASGGSVGDEIEVGGIYTLDASSAYGICWQNTVTGVYIIRGAVNIGDTTGTANTYFLTDGEVIIAEDLPYVADDTLQFNFGGNGTGTTDIRLLGCFVGAAGTKMNMSTSDSNIDFLFLGGNTFNNIDGLGFLQGNLITNNVFDNCYIVDVQDASVTNCTFANSTDASAAMLWDTTTSSTSIHDCLFNDNTTAIYIPASETGPITLDGMLFSGNTTDIYWAGTAGTLTVNNSGGSNASSSSSAGGTVSIVSSVSLSMTVTDSNQDPVEGAKAYIDDPANTAPYIMNTTTNSSGIASVSWGGGAVSGAYWRVRLYGYKPFLAISDIGTVDKEIPVTLVVDPQQY